MADTLLSAQGLAVAVGRRPLLDGLDLALESGERIALRGPSGCGKTSLLRVLGGLDQPAAGRVLLAGQAPGECGWPHYRRQVVLVPQEPVMLAGTVEENLSRPFTYRSASAPFPASRARELLVRLHLDRACWTWTARQLSVGERQRVALVRALLLEPRVLLLDEPTSALDAAAAAAAEGLLLDELERLGAGALIVTHDGAQTERWGTRACHLDPHLCSSEPAVI